MLMTLGPKAANKRRAAVLPPQSGLKLWLKFDELAGADGANITALTDASPAATALTVTSGNAAVRAAILNGRKVMEVTGNADWLALPAGFLTGDTEGTCYIRYKQNAAIDQGAAFRAFGTSGSIDHTPYTDNTIYYGMLSNSRKTAATYNSATRQAWHDFSCRSKASLFNIQVNGSEVYTTGSNTVATGTAPRLLANLRCFVAEMLYYNVYLSDAQLAEVKAALDPKWGTV